MLKGLLRFVIGSLGWKMEGQPPRDLSRYVLVCFPHTSNWDNPLLLSYCYLHDVPLRWMAKDSIFKGPMKYVWKALGGIPIDRSRHHNMVASLTEVIKSHESIVVSVPPEGTRKKVPYWKTGFYYLALGAGVPLVLSFIDGPRKCFGVGPVIYPSGDIHADLEKIKAFYQDMKGIYPDKTSPILLKPEQPAPTP